MTGAKHLLLTPHGYTLRVKVPSDLRERIDKREIKKSLFQAVNRCVGNTCQRRLLTRYQKAQSVSLFDNGLLVEISIPSKDSRVSDFAVY